MHHIIPFLLMHVISLIQALVYRLQISRSKHINQVNISRSKHINIYKLHTYKEFIFGSSKLRVQSSEVTQ